MVRLFSYKLGLAGLLGLVAGTLIACQRSATSPSAPPSSPGPETTAPAANLPVYRSDRNRFQFSYPAEYRVDARTLPEGSDAIEEIELWTQADYETITADSFEGTEPPPNVSVTVHPNPQSLDLEAWIAQSNRFVAPENVTATSFAGQPALTFFSTGLYEYSNVVVAHPENTAVIVISLGGLDRTAIEPEAAGAASNYRSAFEQILTTFTFEPL